MNIVVILSANAEWHAIQPLFPNVAIERSPFGEYFRVSPDTHNGSLVTFFHGGWGKIAAAA
ncbi:MAG: hypothetical protein RMJ85_10475, partial [Anaerolineales bacterium]|nr:hypothetical protein [Anaerolineales bacterium]